MTDYTLHAAGHRWTVADVEVVELPDGAVGVSQAELARVHRAVANAICGASGVLTFDELEFFCDVTDVTFASVARHLELNKSTITVWRRKGTVPSRLVSNALKRWFWFKLFGADVGDQRLPLSVFSDDVAFLASATRHAIATRAAAPVALKEAS